MGTVAWVVVIIVTLPVLAALAYLGLQYQQRLRLQRLFGAEYDRVIEREGDRRTGEAKLREREQRRHELQLTTLSDAAKDGFRENWRSAQGEFVDNPARALASANQLVDRVLREIGYPEDDADLLTVDHPGASERYRLGLQVYVRTKANPGETNTEDLRSAFLHYRELFDALLQKQPEPRTQQGATDGRPARRRPADLLVALGEVADRVRRRATARGR